MRCLGKSADISLCGSHQSSQYCVASLLSCRRRTCQTTKAKRPFGDGTPNMDAHAVALIWNNLGWKPAEDEDRELVGSSFKHMADAGR